MSTKFVEKKQDFKVFLKNQKECICKEKIKNINEIDYKLCEYSCVYLFHAVKFMDICEAFPWT